MVTHFIKFTHIVLYTHTQIHMHTQIHTHTHTYIHHGHVWHRNKLSRCQMELLISSSDNVHQTSLKWDRSSHPVTPECCVCHTLRLKYTDGTYEEILTVLQYIHDSICLQTRRIPGCSGSKIFTQSSKFVNKRQAILPHQDCLPHYSPLLRRFHDISVSSPE